MMGVVSMWSFDIGFLLIYVKVSLGAGERHNKPSSFLLFFLCRAGVRGSCSSSSPTLLSSVTI